MKLIDWIAEERGRAVRLAEALGLTNPANPVSVYQWANGTRQVPAERCPAIERVTGGAVRCEELRPDVDWGVLRGVGCIDGALAVLDVAQAPSAKAAA